MDARPVRPESVVAPSPEDAEATGAPMGWSSHAYVACSDGGTGVCSSRQDPCARTRCNATAHNKLTMMFGCTMDWHNAASCSARLRRSCDAEMITVFTATGMPCQMPV